MPDTSRDSQPGRFRSIPLVGSLLTMIGATSTRDQHGNVLRADTVQCASGARVHLENGEAFPELHGFMLRSAWRDFQIDGETEALGRLPSPLQRVCNGETIRIRRGDDIFTPQ